MHTHWPYTHTHARTHTYTYTCFSLTYLVPYKFKTLLIWSQLKKKLRFFSQAHRYYCERSEGKSRPCWKEIRPWSLTCLRTGSWGASSWGWVGIRHLVLLHPQELNDPNVILWPHAATYPSSWPSRAGNEPHFVGYFLSSRFSYLQDQTVWWSGRNWEAVDPILFTDAKWHPTVWLSSGTSHLEHRKWSF